MALSSKELMCSAIQRTLCNDENVVYQNYLIITGATTHMQFLSDWNVPSRTEKMNFYFL